MDNTQSKNNFLVPIAIVVAGIIVATAIIFSGNKVATTTNGENVPQNIDIKKISEDDHVLGNPNADLVIIEYSDLECPFCKDFHQTMDSIMKEYGVDGKVAWVYRHFWSERKMPNGQIFHPKGGVSAEASECVAELGGNQKFWDYTKLIFEGQPGSLDRLVPIAESLGINKGEMEKCLSEGRYKGKVAAQYAEGKAIGVSGTPNTYIVTKNGVYPISGAIPLADMRKIVETALNE